MIQARPTTYKGIEMRSRLEALFAEHLDGEPLYGCWEYEPRCFASEGGQYLPDFYVLMSNGIEFGYVEVKPPVADREAALDRMHIILDSEPEARLFVAVGDGSYPAPRFGWSGCTPDSPCPRCNRLSTRPRLIHSTDGLLCAWCRRPGPALIKDGTHLAPWVGDLDGPPVRATVGLHCDGCDERFYVYVSTGIAGETNLGVLGQRRADR